MPSNEFKPGVRVKVINCKRMPSLNNRIGTFICTLKYPNQTLYGASFDHWRDGHSLRMAQVSLIPDHLLSLIDRNNCWWLEDEDNIEQLHDTEET